MVKKIISSAIVIAILISTMIVPVRAFDGLVGVGQTFFDWMIKARNATKDAFWYLIFGDDWMSADETDLESAYDTYVSDLQTDLGSTVLIDGGIRCYFSPTGASGTKLTAETVWNLTPTSVTGTIVTENLYKSTSSDQTSHATLYFVYEDGIKAPFTCTYQFGESGSFSSSSIYKSLSWPEKNNTGEASPGTVIYAANSVYTGGSYVRRLDMRITARNIVVGNIEYSVWVDLFPKSGLPSVTNLNIDQSTRVGSVAGDFIYGDQIIENMQIVNETNNTFFNPVTNETINYNNWSYDYSDRSYNLTLETGASVEVRFGDEYLTINEGDTIYNIYYYITNEAPPVDPDAPGTDDGSGWAWLQSAWTQMMDKLSEILKAITSLELSPEINVDVEVNEGETVTQESWFSNFLAKFSFLSSIRDIYSQMVADVTSDVATAAAVAGGDVMLADVTGGHAATDGSTSYTAPELAVSLGESDKYGVDWANIRVLDLSWYAPHKKTVDGILSGILWLSYLFLLIKRAPGIIRGSEMVTEDSIKIDKWRARH